MSPSAVAAAAVAVTAAADKAGTKQHTMRAANCSQPLRLAAAAATAPSAGSQQAVVQQKGTVAAAVAAAQHALWSAAVGNRQVRVTYSYQNLL